MISNASHSEGKLRQTFSLSKLLKVSIFSKSTLMIRTAFLSEHF